MGKFLREIAPHPTDAQMSIATPERTAYFEKVTAAQGKTKVKDNYKSPVCDQAFSNNNLDADNQVESFGDIATIASAIQIGKIIYVRDMRGNIIFMVSADTLLSYTNSSVTVRVASNAIVYDSQGLVINIQTLV
jgi:hypothetical protein